MRKWLRSRQKNKLAEIKNYLLENQDPNKECKYQKQDEIDEVEKNIGQVIQEFHKFIIAQKRLKINGNYSG